MLEPIDVISVFRKKAVSPLKFRYAGRTHRVARILYAWVTREGSFPVHHFSVLTTDGDRRELSLDTYTMAWLIEIEETDADEKTTARLQSGPTTKQTRNEKHREE